jgi:hypothetical protein
MIARKALTTAQEAKKKNEQNKSTTELKKRNAELAIANIHNLLAKELSVGF